jgi:isoleucyl-tRNA synthetase
MISRGKFMARLVRAQVWRPFAEDVDNQEYKQLILKNYNLREEDQKQVKTQEAPIKISSRGKGGKNELKLLKYVVDGAILLNKNRPALSKLDVMTGPVNITGNPHLGVMANTLIRDTFLRFELLRGKSISNSLSKRQ